MTGPVQWTPGGVVNLSSVPIDGQHQIVAGNPFVVVPQATEDERVEAAGAVAAGARARAKRAARGITPKDVISLARARLREVKAELRRMRALDRERQQLERLLKAADGKPLAVVRDMKRPTG